MTLSKTPVVVVSILLLTVLPAHAQRRGGGGGASRGGGGGFRSAAPRASAPRSSGPSRAVAPRGYSSPRGIAGSSRSYSYGGSRVYGAGPRGVVGGRALPRVVGSRGYGVGVAPYRFYRPYYSFRPRVSLGFGLWVGFPVTYPYYYGYYDPYYYGYSYPYSYGPSYPAYRYPYYPSAAYPAYPTSTYPQSAYPERAAGSIGVQPGQANTGGISFEITPNTAEVFVDGSYVGTVGEFTPTSQALGLTPGRHRIEIRASGYRSWDFEEDIVAGQVIPYQGTLQR